ncbi:uncharacterized protein At1g65710 [Oryza sativa Japonica Group]|uniref:Uncharacterized protein n=2 Tax=Oryza sativa subsp. japonica TaxID=39947 RepID=Q6H5V5_ORYSJ|nr:uncharacterized protein At1g65710 [Oryza sativa Japonica Group]BAD25339.1 hypothetical protein [Oryza sativa Japonica Group]BAD25894.1 hypothetical protein [Oryza sativa Japonica Group]
MGLCCSKTQKETTPPHGGAEATTSPQVKRKSGKIAADDKGKKTRAGRAVEAAGDKKAVFVVKTKSGAVNVEERRPVVVVPTMPVRTSSCTKEEVDAILIQCGRLSRSSSGRAASSETGAGHRRSKRSYDFDQERRPGCGGGGDEERDWERHGGAVSRPSPHRGSPQRKRSGSRERSSGGGSRRASRSPGRRAEGVSPAPAPAGSGGGGGGGERVVRQQPGKMVSVPAREKARAPSPAAASGKRCASPRSSSPARMVAAGNENAGGGQMTAAQTPSLSRSSSPYRRSPMAEIDENSLRNNNGANHHKKISENALAIAAAPQKATERSKEKPKVVEETVLVAAAPPASKTTATRTASATAESLNTKARSRRASRDFDQNTNSYATQLLEDIQSYHQQQNTTSVAATAATLPSFSLPACVSKACSILDAVADLNSSSSDSHSCEPDRSANDRGSVNAPLGGGMDDLAEPGVHKRHATAPRGDIRGGGGETEPQESAGSNSVSGNPWTPSWEPNSVESTDRTWSASRSTNNGDEVVEQGSSSHAGARSPLNRSRQSSKQRAAQPEHSVRSRAGSSGGNSNNVVHRGRGAHRSGGGGGGSVASGRSGVRAVSAMS